MSAAPDSGMWRADAAAPAVGGQRRADLERGVRPSLLDRLLDDERELTRERPPTRAASEAAFRRAVRRDLEWLLNTRRQLAEVPEGREELRRSLLRYGLPDVASMPRDVPEARARLVRALEETITLFEPRLTQVRVVLAGDGERGPADAHGAGELRFLIEAVLLLDPEPERVVFETTFEPSEREYRVRGGGAGDA